MSWHAVDGSGHHLSTGRPPAPVSAPSPAEAVAAVPVITWPLAVVGSDGSRLTFGEALGPGGDGVERLLATLLDRHDSCAIDPERLATETPLGTVRLPVTQVPLPEAVEAAASVDVRWLAAVDERRSRPRRALLHTGRAHHLEAALHVAMILATERLDPRDDTDVDAHIASGAMLWILGGAVAWALASGEDAPFAPWAAMVARGLWPVGPSRGRLVLARAAVGASAI